jgi:hypothetical protein
MMALEWLALYSIVPVYEESEAGFLCLWLDEVEDVASETCYISGVLPCRDYLSQQ